MTCRQQDTFAVASSRMTSTDMDTLDILPKFSQPKSPLSPNSPASQPHDTLASIYMVCGLPKNPQCWTLAQPDCSPSHLPGAVPRFWRPEVLGTTVSGQDILSASTSSSQGPNHRARIPSRPHSSTSSSRKIRSSRLDTSELDINKEELSRIQAKAIKLAFAREVEIIASNLQPPSTTHCFSFTVPATSTNLDQPTVHPIGQQWELVPNFTPASSSLSSNEKTYYAACLQVWSHSDKMRSEAVKKTLEENSSKSKSIAIARAIQAAAAGRKFGSKLQKALNSPMGLLSLSNQEDHHHHHSLPRQRISTTSSIYQQDKPPNSPHSTSLVDYNTAAEVEDTEGFFSESEWETPCEPPGHESITSRLLNHDKIHLHQIDDVLNNTPLWLPHCLILISKFPIFDLMVDHLKISWARYHDSIYKHSKEMLKIPVYKSTSLIKLPVGSSRESNTKFVVKLPGKSDLSNSALEEVNIGLSPMGRIVFFSNYPAMLNIAVESFKLLLELRGWVGLSQSIVHSRDFKIYLEDPGPFILGANSQLRHVAANISPEIMVVDLDTDTIDCRKPHPTALSKGHERARIEKKIFHYLGSFTGSRSVPPELHEAFPGGRFRPFSAVEVQDQPSEAERLLPPPEWNWEQSKTIIVFDNIMSRMPTKGIAKLLKRRTYRQAAVLDSSALHVQEIIRKHTISFVNRRDMLETKIWKLNRRLAFLISESMDWKQHFEQFQKFTDMLSQESQELKTRLENERREHRTLTGVVAEQLNRQAELENKLLETEKAWMAAQVELAKAHDIREELQRQKQIMVSEMKSIALGGDDEDLLEKIVPRVESCIASPCKAGAKNRVSLTTKNLSRLSAQVGYSLESPDTSSSRIEKSEIVIDGSPNSRIASSAEHDNSTRADSDDETISDDVSGLSEIMEERALLSRSAVIETMRSIQGRLESALRTAGQLDEEEIKSMDSSTGLGKSALARLSTDSYDSKVIHLQRGRRKPINSVLLDRENSYTSKSSSSPHKSVQVDHDSHKIDFSCQMENLSSNRSGRASTVSLILPGATIFGQRPNSASLRDSVSASSIAPSTSDGLRSHRFDSVVNEESEEEDENDYDDDRGTSFDDGASFVSANDDGASVDHRRLSIDSGVMLASDSGPSSQQDHSNPISRVSLIGSALLDRVFPDHEHSPSTKPTKSQAADLIAFPTKDSHLDTKDKQAADGSEDVRSILNITDGFGPLDGATLGQQMSSTYVETDARNYQGIENYNKSLVGPNKSRKNFINHRVSNISSSSASTIKIKHNPNLPHPHLRHPMPRTLSRKSNLSPKENTVPEIPVNPSSSTNNPSFSPSFNGQFDTLPKHFASLPTSRRLGSPNTSLVSNKSFYPFSNN